MKRCSLIMMIVAIGISVVGCGQSIEIAQQGLQRGSDSNYSVRHALFTQAWGENRALITASRKRFLAEARLAVAKGEKSPDQALTEFEDEVGKDEVVVSGNFAYLALLLVAGERADGLMLVADNCLESKKPMWKQSSEQARIGAKEAMDELDRWTPVLSDLKSKLPIDAVRAMLGLGKTATAPPQPPTSTP